MPEEPVRYKKLDKNAYWIKINQNDIIAWRHPTEEAKAIEGALGAQGGSGKYEASSKSEWQTVIHDKDRGLLPFGAWESLKNDVAAAISTASGSTVNPSDLVLSRTIPQDKLAKCPKCGNTLFILTDFSCSYCKEKIL